MVACESVEENKHCHDNSSHEAGNLSDIDATRLPFGLNTNDRPGGDRSLGL